VVAMGVRALADTLHGSTGWLLPQVDLKNAFNSIQRPAILDFLRTFFGLRLSRFPMSTPMKCHSRGQHSPEISAEIFPWKFFRKFPEIYES